MTPPDGMGPQPLARDLPPPGWSDYARALGPGLVAGASDLDPTTVATIAIIGATTVYGLSWLVLLTFPLLAVVEVISARTAAVSGQDLQRLVGRRCGRTAGTVLLVSILGVAVLTLAADLEAGAAAIGLLVHTGWQWFVVPLAVAVVALIAWGTYDGVKRVLEYVLLVLLAYVAAAVLAHPHWVQVARHSVLPAFHWSRAYVEGALALLGTTLTSYVYVWQTVEIAEEKPPRPRLKLEQAGAAAGIAFAVLLFWFILVATGATLGVHHARVATPEDAARALQPVAGRFASDLFGIGLLSSALVALPVVLGTIGYVVGARFGWRRGLSAPVKRAPRFYAVVLITMAAGAGIGLAGVSPIRLLFLASVAGGLATPIGLAYLLLVARDRYLMGEDAVSGWLELTGWAVAVVITGLSLVYLALQLLSW